MPLGTFRRSAAPPDEASAAAQRRSQRRQWHINDGRAKRGMLEYFYGYAGAEYSRDEIIRGGITAIS